VIPDDHLAEKEVPSAAGSDIEHLNTDGRRRGEWASRYDDVVRRQIRIEAGFVGIILLLTLVSILLTWRGTLFQWMTYGCASCVRTTFDEFAYFYLGGQLGGILYGVKYLYKVVASGFWNVDRRLWRFFSPFLSGSLALVIGTLFDSGVLGLTIKTSANPAYFSIGFIAGYFADSALAKMQEIAYTVFGSPSQRKPTPKV